MKKVLLSSLTVAVFSWCAAPSLAQVYSLEPLWSLAPGSRTYLGTGGLERGMTYNPATGHVLVLSRSDNKVHVLDGLTGADGGTMNMGAILTTGVGTFKLNMIGAAANGEVFVGNLTTDSRTTPFQLWRWADESAAPQLVYSGDPTGAATAPPSAVNTYRFGDTLAVRSDGPFSQVLAASRGAAWASLIVHDSASPNPPPAFLLQSDVATPTTGNGPFGLGVAFGLGDTFWAKSSGGAPLRQLGYDRSAGTATTLQAATAQQVPDTVFPLGYDPAANLVAGISVATPDKINLYDGTSFALLDSEVLPADNANGNGVGSVDFGESILYVLDTNNGLAAFTVIPEPHQYAWAAGLLLTGFAFLRRHRRRA